MGTGDRRPAGQQRRLHAVAGSLPLLGHAYPTVRALQDLVRRGHRVTILCSEAAREAVASWPEAEGMQKVFVADIETPEQLAEEIRFRFEPGAPETVFGAWGRRGRPLVRQALQKLHETDPVDVVVADQTSFAYFQAADDLGIPSVANCPGSGSLTFLLGYTPMPSSLKYLSHLARLYDRIPGLSTSFGLIYLLDDFVKYVRGRPALINCTLAFSDINRAHIEGLKLSELCVFTGSLVEAPIVDGGDGEVPDSGVQGFLDQEPFTPVVLLSMGTTQTDLSSQQIERIVRGAVDGPWRTIITLHEKRVAALPADLRSLPDVHFSSWIPQAQVLMHPRVKAFVTHCGWGATTEALSAGVPVVCLPCFGDQSTNAKILVGAKQGIRLNPMRLKAEALTAAIEGVLLDTEVKEAARQNRIKFCRESGGSSAAADFVEAVATGQLEVPPRHLALASLPLGLRPVSAIEASLVWGLVAVGVGAAGWCALRYLQR